MFTYLDTPVSLTVSQTYGAWVDCDVSAYVPSGATGVLLHVVDTKDDAGKAWMNFRKNGSTDDRTDYGLYYYGHTWRAVGVDSNRIFEYYHLDTSGGTIGSYKKLYLIGYFGDEAVFFDNGIDKSTATTGSFVDIDISGHTGEDTAIGAIFEVYCQTSSEYSHFFRKKGSSTDIYDTYYGGKNGTFIVGVNESGVCQQKIKDTGVDVYLIGYIKSGFVFETDMTDYSLSTIGSYVDLNALPSGATGGLFWVFSKFNRFDLRKKGYETAIYEYPNSCTAFAFVQCNGDRIVEGKITNTNCDFYLIGYTTSGGSSTNIKTVLGLNKASVKSVNGLGIASVKSFNGLT